MHTPWGKADSVHTVAQGIKEVSTPSHGGIWLDQKHQDQLPIMLTDTNFLHSLQWWEEDCDWCVPFLMFADEFRRWYEDQGEQQMYESNLASAKRIAERYHPKFYEWYTVRRFDAMLTAMIGD